MSLVDRYAMGMLSSAMRALTHMEARVLRGRPRRPSGPQSAWPCGRWSSQPRCSKRARHLRHGPGARCLQPRPSEVAAGLVRCSERRADAREEYPVHDTAARSHLELPVGGGPSISSSRAHGHTPDLIRDFRSDRSLCP
jgi:hypothetical protein